MNLSRLIAGGLSAVLMFAAGGEPAAKPPTPVIIESAQQQSRTVQVGDRDVVQVNTRLRFTTLISLPKKEVVMDVLCGDSAEWVINSFAGTNFVSAKPSKAQAQTNLNVIGASGRVYSFLLTEGASGTNPDMKLFVELNDAAQQADSKPRFVAASELDDYRVQIDLARMQATEAKKAAAEELAAKTAQLNAEVSKLKAEVPASMKFDYEFKDAAPFNVSAIYQDGRMTYIKASPAETPVLYEVADGKESLIDYRYENGLYVVPKVMTRGWLRIGKKRLDFERKGS